ncbi:MAG: electron transport complex subunit RsxC [Spirochaetia bacterium]
MTHALLKFQPARLFRKSFRHGIRPDGNKHYTEHRRIERLAFPSQLHVVLSQHEGTPPEPVVRPGQEVVRGEPIARAAGDDSVALHAPATGVVKSIDLVPTAKGPRKEAIIIDVYPGDTQEVSYGTSRDVDRMSPAEIVQAVQEAGLVGLGGETLPTHAKLAPSSGKAIETVIINGCESEPYLTADHRIMLEQTDAVMRGIRIIMRASGAKRAIIATEDNKLDAAEALRSALPEGLDVSVKVLKTKYPQGAEQMLTKVLLNREIPSGESAAAIGAGVFNVATTAQLGELLPRGRGVIERTITVSGPGIASPGNYTVPIGTPLGFILKRLDYQGTAKYLVNGGSMRGETVASLDVPITKATDGFLVFRPEDMEYRVSDEYPCINCGACLDACPVNLNPAHLGKLAARRNYLEMGDYNLFDCFECGACSYVCPSGIPLVQHFRVSKAMYEEEKAASEDE